MTIEKQTLRPWRLAKVTQTFIHETNTLLMRYRCWYQCCTLVYFYLAHFSWNYCGHSYKFHRCYFWKAFVVMHNSGLCLLKRGSRTGYRHKHKWHFNNTEKFLRPYKERLQVLFWNLKLEKHSLEVHSSERNCA